MHLFVVILKCLKNCLGIFAEQCISRGKEGRNVTPAENLP